MFTTHNKSRTFTIATISLLLIGIGAWAGLAYTSPAQDTVAQASVSPEATRSVSRTTISYIAKPGMTSLVQLQSEASQVVIKTSQYGKYVDAIEGHKGGDAGKYWSFYVDDRLASVGADSYIQKGGEKITWKFQKL